MPPLPPPLIPRPAQQWQDEDRQQVEAQLADVQVEGLLEDHSEAYRRETLRPTGVLVGHCPSQVHQARAIILTTTLAAIDNREDREMTSTMSDIFFRDDSELRLRQAEQ